MRRCCSYLQRRVHSRSPDRHKTSGRLGPRSEWQVLISGVVRTANNRTRGIADARTAAAKVSRGSTSALGPRTQIGQQRSDACACFRTRSSRAFVF